jgi:CRISPR/Cas system CSM-associated protein Csm3 (group 7 of RAMP superfamily)
MHKRFVNHCTIELSLTPDGPILIKSGKEGADPTKPDMEFVETYHQGGRTVYLPGSSLKGAIRAHAERIVRTIGSEQRKQGDHQHLWASNPLKLNDYDYLKDYSETHDLYKWSSFTDQLFGSTEIASRLRIEDAYPVDPKQLKLEERNGVAIDRVFGSVAVGPFNYQVCTDGAFRTKIHLKNFTLAQLGLIGLVLRDLNDGWFGIGFAKSRGLGTVAVQFEKAIVQYPGCILDAENQKIVQLGSSKEPWDYTQLLGVGAFLEDEEKEHDACDQYGFPRNDVQDTPVAAQAMPLGFGVQLTWQGDTVTDLFERAVRAWRVVLGAAA